MSRAFPWFKLYVNDYWAMVAALKPAEAGIFMHLCVMMFERDGEIDRDDELFALRFRCRVSELKKILANLIKQQLVIEQDGRLTAPYVQAEIADRQKRAQKASKAGSANAEKQRKISKQNQAQDAAQEVLGECLDAAMSESTNQNDDEEEARIVHFDAGETADRYRERILEAVGFNDIERVTSPEAQRLGSQENMIEARKWREGLGLTEDQVIQEIRDTMIRKGSGPPKSLRYFSPSMSDLRKRLDTPLPEAPLNTKTTRQTSKGSYHAASTRRSRNEGAYLSLADQIRSGAVNFRIGSSS